MTCMRFFEVPAFLDKCSSKVPSFYQQSDLSCVPVWQWYGNIFRVFSLWIVFHFFKVNARPFKISSVLIVDEFSRKLYQRKNAKLSFHMHARALIIWSSPTCWIVAKYWYKKLFRISSQATANTNKM